jgi:hypothetical protein
MRMPDLLLKSVGFVSRFEPEEDGARLRFGGTAFIVGVHTGANYGLAHIVTAKHVAEAIAPDEAVIAMNAKDGMPRYLRSGSQDWFYHPTEPDSVDVAVLPFGTPNFKEYDITWIPEEIFATEKRIAEFDIGLGDEIVIIGLFTRFFGRKELVPLVRTGNVAMMPREKLPIRGFGDMEAYLAEGRSIGGLSGSPVFVRNTVKMQARTDSGSAGYMSGLGRFHLLGLMHGHWDLPVSFSPTEQAEAVNMGVSIVVPAKKILETLYHPRLVEMRARFMDDSRKQEGPTKDATLGGMPDGTDLESL